jgi:hypothetical protein
VERMRLARFRNTSCDPFDACRERDRQSILQVGKFFVAVLLLLYWVTWMVPSIELGVFLRRSAHCH